MKISKLSTALLIGLGGLIGITKDLGASEIGAGGMQIVRQSSTTQVGQTFELDLQLPGVVDNVTRSQSQFMSQSQTNFSSLIRQLGRTWVGF